MVKKHVIDKYDTDVYIHCWQPEYHDFLVENYKPRKIITESTKNWDHYQPQVDPEINGMWGPPAKYFSQYYSFSTSHNLIDKKYDIVIMMRFESFEFGIVNSILFLDVDRFLKNCIYTDDWDQINAGLLPHNIIGEQSLMNKLFKNMVEDVLSYFSTGSDYIKLSSEIGWPYSVDSPPGKGRYSKEILKKNPSKKLLKYHKYEIANDHLFLKYHFYRHGLLDNVCYVTSEGKHLFSTNYDPAKNVNMT